MIAVALLAVSVYVMRRELLAAKASAANLHALDLARTHREDRAASAERRVDSLLGVVTSIHLHAREGAGNFDKAMGLYDGSHWLLPIFSEAQFGASRMRAIERTADEVLLLTRGDQHGRERRQEDRV